jgi:hypothetical protein
MRWKWMASAVAAVAVAVLAAGQAAADTDASKPWSQRFKLIAATGDGNVSWLPGGMVGLVAADDGAATQRWDGLDVLAKGGKTLTLHNQPGQCLDVATADSGTDGARLLLRQCDLSYRQSWVLAFDPVHPNTVRIVNYASKLVVTVSHPGTKAVELIQTAYRPAAPEQVFYTDNCDACG